MTEREAKHKDDCNPLSDAGGWVNPTAGKGVNHRVPASPTVVDTNNFPVDDVNPTDSRDWIGAQVESLMEFVL